MLFNAVRPQLSPGHSYETGFHRSVFQISDRIRPLYEKMFTADGASIKLKSLLTNI
jgi:hypothetical protein